jgi:uncharacterized protein (TIGR00251 family)
MFLPYGTGWRTDHKSLGGKWVTIRVVAESVDIAVRLKPRGSRDELLGVRDGVLEAKVTAPPVDGRANKALCKLIAKRVGVAPSQVTVVRGAKSREKVVRVEGVEKKAIESALGAS